MTKKNKSTVVSAVMVHVIVYNVMGPVGYGWVYNMPDGRQIPYLFTYDDDEPIEAGFYSIIPDNTKPERMVVMTGTVQ